MAEATVYVVDDDAAMRSSLRWLLETVRLPVVTFESAEQFLATYRGGSGCVVLDVRMPGMSGLELQEEMARRGLELPVILLTGHGDVPMAVRAMHAGAFDFIQKPYNGQTLIERVRAALAEGVRRRERSDQQAERRARLDALTAREREVLARVAVGEPNKVIAAELGISLRTVEVHRHNLMEKLGAHSIGDVIRLYLSAQETSS